MWNLLNDDIKITIMDFLDLKTLRTFLSLLNKHKKWLEQFKEKQHKVKEQLQEKTKQEEEKFKKIK